MADEHDTVDPEQAKALAKVAGAFLDMTIQVIAVQYALMDAGLLKLDQVQKHLDRLNQLPLVLTARSIYGPRSEVIDALLRSYEGPVQ
jgi:hypothetical protein